jgi:TolB-like protein/cytochrome c-type biogenesis protein CcmH/NrfG
MTPEKWLQIRDILEAAWNLDEPAARAAFLDRTCARDPAIRAEVEALLASGNCGHFLTEPQFGLSALVAAAIHDEETAGELLAGARIGRYAIQERIGEGGMGFVYRAVRQDDFRMEVAIKVLKRWGDSEAALERFRAERQILAELQHPNIARLLDGGTTDTGLPYLVMEYVDGTPLLEYALRLKLRDRLELFCCICQSVQYAHRHSIVHRDIKPANILVTREGVPKLLDFGIAKLLDSTSEEITVTSSGTRPMTVAYASPEQIRGGRIMAASDIYSLGALLYELLTGERATAAGMLPKPSAIVEEVDPDLDNIVLMALRQEPEQRYASSEALSGDIGRFLQNLPVRAGPGSVRYRVRKFLQRNRVLATATALTAAIVLLGVAGVWRFAGTDMGPRSIAVLPLENLSGADGQNYFAEGVTDALINSLGEIQGVQVISRTSSMTFKGVRRPLPEIARMLGVRTIAEGSVFRAGNRVRVIVRLLDARREHPMWSGSYEGELRDVLGLQEKIAAAVAREIGVTLSGRDPRQARIRRVDIEAYDAYLQGRREFLNAISELSIKNAVQWFQKALSLDPGYAPAYAALADCYYQVCNQYQAPVEVMPQARAAALKAIELDDTLGEAHAILALVRSMYDFNRAEGEKGFRRALKLKPGDAEIHLLYALHLTAMGRFGEAASELERARKLDPVSPSLNTYSGAILYYQHRYDEVIRRMQPIVEHDPNYNQPHAWLGLAYEQKGECAPAIAEMRRAIDLYPTAAGDGGEDGRAQLAHIYAMCGRTAEARQLLAQVTEAAGRRYVSAWAFAMMYAGLGDREEGLRWLRKVNEDRSEMFALVNVDPRFDALRSDPRFLATLRSAGLAPR